MKHLIQRGLILTALLYAGWAAAGALYTWVDAEGNKHISDRPPLDETYNTKLDETKKMTGTAPGRNLFASASRGAASGAAGAASAAASSTAF